jgi:hypothetical protein
MLDAKPGFPCVPVVLADLPNVAQAGSQAEQRLRIRRPDNSGTQHKDFGENPKASLHAL